MTEIYIISGFLGAGKTTLIQKLLQEAFLKGKTALIENDFGEISVDAALLRADGLKVRELSSGCICCSLSGDFTAALLELLKTYHPDRILIEPSGVGKLSDIFKACSHPRILPLAGVKTKITVADASRFFMYQENFGEFFEDQIRQCDAVVLSRCPAASPEILQGIRQLNPCASVFSGPWEQLDISALLGGQDSCTSGQFHEHEEHCGHTDCTGAHCHKAAEAFDTVTVYPRHPFTQEGLRKKTEQAQTLCQSRLLRAKGIVKGTAGYWELQLVQGEFTISPTKAVGNAVSFIGQGLDESGLRHLFENESA